MRQIKWKALLGSLLLCLVLLVTGCQQQPPSPYDQVQAETSQRNAPGAVAKEATKGGSFNKLFPKAEGEYDRVFSQEKKGFAEAKLKKDGKDVAMLSISDTSSLPSAAAKFAQATDQIAGYPAVELGNTQTAILVANRYQVKVLSRDPAFDQSSRQAWIQKFDLQQLAQLE